MNLPRNIIIKSLKTILKKGLLFLMIFYLFAFTALAQSDFVFDLDALNKEDIHQVDLSDLEINLAPAPINNSGESLPAKEWTIMVYMSTKSNLEKSGLKDVNEMEKVGSGAKYNVVVELGRIEGHTSLDGDWTGARRYYIEKDRNPFIINSPMLMAIPKVNMGDWNHLIDFVKWAKSKYPAKRYMLIVGSHGSGWLKGKPVVADKGISYDEETENNIDTPQLGKVLKDVGKIDVYASDSCLMQMVEISYEIGNSVDYIIGSEGIIPFSGYSFDGILDALRLNPEISSLELSKAVVDSFIPKINFRKRLSVVDAKYLHRLPGLTNNFVKAVMKTENKEKIIKARKKTRKYKLSDNKDFYDFIEEVVKKIPDETLEVKGKALMSFLKQVLIEHKGKSFVSLKKGNGIGIYLPADEYDRDYNELKWAGDSKWDDFIRWQLN